MEDGPPSCEALVSCASVRYLLRRRAPPPLRVTLNDTPARYLGQGALHDVP